MRLLIINPNTTPAMTEKVAKAAPGFIPRQTVIVTATGRFGPAYIASWAAFAVASHAAIDAYAANAAGCDAVLLACFGDPGLEAIREVSPVPVISLIDAACAEAGANGRRFTILTGGERWGPMLAAMLKSRQLDGQLASIRTLAPTGGSIAANPAATHQLFIDTCQAAIREDGAEAIILGGAGLMGIAAAIQPAVQVPVICSVEAGLRAAATALRVARPARPDASTDAVPSIGLSPELARLLAEGGQARA
ncbi:MAG: aspartate/glutamate racemase family protein [Hyphomicrobiales bacterium]|nr:aspartate/glutamate racemase family protein [Hyphomicrobiales bacterium]